MNSKQRLPELDLLRFCAALSVTLYHLCRWPAGGHLVKSAAQFGFLGVNVFFVISGYVILMTAESRTALEFLKSRFVRLFPTFWICVAITSTALALAGETPSLPMVAANLTMVPPLFHQPFVDLVYWTLVVELRFYAMVLLLLMFRQMARLELWLALWVAGMCASLLPVTPALQHWQHALQWLTLQPWGSLFAAGCYFYLVRTRGASWRYFAPLAVCLGLSVFEVCTNQDGSQYAWARGEIVTMGAFVTLAYAVFLTLSLNVWRPRPHAAWYWLGGLTYPLYLLHAQAGRILWVALPGSEWARSAMVLVASLLLAAWLARYSERRACNALRRGLDRLEARIRAKFSRPRAALPPSA
jgi:peptidoglycan/LPS O-acetylase OafA/YrhL